MIVESIIPCNYKITILKRHFMNKQLITMRSINIIERPFFNQFIFLVIIFISLPILSFSTTTLILKDPNTISSPKHVFKFGFFTPSDTTNRYLGIFYAATETTVVWVANRDNPLTDFSGAVVLSDRGNLLLINGRNETVWSTNVTTSSTAMNSKHDISVRILDIGNLVVRDEEAGAIIWESFSQPSDVFLPTMKLSHDTNTGKTVFLTSWKDTSDPEEGIFKTGIEASNIPQMFTWKNERPYWRSGQWNGVILIGVHGMYRVIDGFQIVNDTVGKYYFTAPEVRNSLLKIQLNSSGTLVESLWDDQKKSWVTPWLSPGNQCDIYGTCGPFGNCNPQDSPICSCVKGFVPTDRGEWERGNWSGGCVRRKALQCEGDRFLKMPFMKVPDFAQQFGARRENECLSRCSRNCSCIAYAYDHNIGCLFWSDTLIDMQDFVDVGVDLHVRLAPSEFEKHKDTKLHVIIPVVVGFVSILALACCAWCWIAKRKGDKTKEKQINVETAQTDSTAIVLKDESESVNIDRLPFFTFETLANATDQFHVNNLLGRGGFGLVYKGNMGNGKEIAVKRLSATSGQGVEEFMNEVIVISKLQHRNLVRLLGCCAERGEKMLIYEYMPNKSLDVCLFDPAHPSQRFLNWRKRFDIIEGIGRGLLYLHKDSRLRIIHRDLKPSNVLLDDNWHPKISDFGLARMFGGNEDHGNTARVVGTYGYMAPEYATEGIFSEKSDVYSFGVLMLEIVKGQKNTHYYNREWSLGLLGCAWKLWSEDNGTSFADERIASSSSEAEIVRCIQIGLLCVQEFPRDRPTILTILSMLSCELVDLPTPEQPIFAEKTNRLSVASTHPSTQLGYSINELTLSALEGR